MQMNLERSIDTLSKAFPTAMLLLSIWKMYQYSSVYANVRFYVPFYFSFHASTMLCLCIAWLVTYRKLNALSVHFKVAVALAFTVLSIHFYDFVWSVFSYLVRGHGLNFYAALFSTVCINIILYVNRKYNFLKIKSLSLSDLIHNIFIWLGFFAFFVLLSTTNFWSAMTLSDLALGSDPNYGNIYWLMTKITGLNLWHIFIDTNYHGEVYDVA